MKVIYMRYFLFLIVLFSFQEIFSQEVIHKVRLGNNEYWVYPYRYKVIDNGYDGVYRSDNFKEYGDLTPEIVPYHGDLPDGKYLMYHAPRRYDYKKKIYTDTIEIAAIFSIKDGKKEGEAFFYHNSYRSDNESGNFKNDQRNGFWISGGYHSYEDSNYYKDPANHRSRKVRKSIKKGIYPARNFWINTLEKTQYVNGIRSGEYKVVGEKDSTIVFEKGQYRDNRKVGNWQTFHANGRLESSYTYSENIIRPEKKYSEYYYERRYYGNQGNDLVPIYDVYEGWYYEYYDNGQLKYKTHYKNGVSKGLDTSYYYNGKIQHMYWFELNPKGDTLVRYKYYEFDYKLNEFGLLKSDYTFYNGEIYHGILYYQGQKDNEIFSKKYYEHLKNKETLVPIQKKYKYSYYLKPGDTSVYEITFWHPITNTEIKKSYYSEFVSSTIDDFTLTFDGKNSYVFNTIDYRGTKDQFEVRSFWRIFRNTEKDSVYFVTELDSSRIYLDGKPYNGKFTLRNGSYRRGKLEKVKIKKNKIKYYSDYFGDEKTFGQPFLDENNLSYYRGDSYSFGASWIRTNTSSYLNYKNGIIHGEAKVVNGKHGRIWDKMNFSNGKLHGEHLEYGAVRLDRWDDKKIYDSSISKKAKMFRRWRFYLMEKAIWLNGVKTGQEMNYYSNGNLEERISYKFGKRDGPSEKFRENGSDQQYVMYSNGQRHGVYKEWYPNKRLMYDLNYSNNIINGTFYFFYPDEQFHVIGEIQSGFKTGDWKTYFEEGNIKYIEAYLVQDSVPSDQPGGNEVRRDYRKSKDENPDKNKTCYSLQHYPTGTVAAEGQINKGVRSGIWKFYDEGGFMIKQINYDPGFYFFKDVNGNKDSISHFGYYQAWYQNGNKESEAYILNESYKFDCYQQTNIAIQDLYYINFWEKSGEQTLSDRNGRISTTHLTTAKTESEGEMKNGLREGYWRFWDPNGKLCKVGNYLNGREDGKWMYGDLEGLNYLDDACFDLSNSMTVKKMEYDKNILNLYVVYFKNGVEIKQNGFEVNLNKVSEYEYYRH